jgi:hypothetical protein
MEPLALKQRQPEESVDVEHWDDDDFDNLDDVQFRSASTATSVVSHPQTGHRDSISRMSMRSDSNHGDENWDVLVDEQAPIKDAIALAKSKGIPLPSNLPRSALEGGTIRRLKGKEIKKAIADDWSEDIDIPTSNAPLKLAKHDDRDLSESLRQISAAFRSSPKSPELGDGEQTIKSPKSKTTATPVSLDSFRDVGDDDDFGDVPTIRVAKHRSPQKPTLITPASLAKAGVDSIEEDLELPTDGQLRLSTQKPFPKTPQQPDDFDFEWGEGSLGFKNAGKSRGGRSARSSSASALSPSVSSAFTGESDDGLDGLVLPEGPIKFDEQLRKRQLEQSQQAQQAPTSAPKALADKDDFFDDFDMGDGDVFSTAKLTLNRNIKHKTQRPTSPSKRTTTTLNFTTTKTQGAISRLPRFQPSHERARSNLEPVSELGAPVARFQRPGSRLGAHSNQSSISSIPTPTTPTPSTPSRRGLRNAESRAEMRYDAPTTTNAQLLRAKRSMPAMRAVNSPTKPAPYVRPPSRQEAGSRLNTSYDRSDSRLGDSRKPTVPFLPAGATTGQSQHVSLKGQQQTAPRHYRRQDSDGSGESMSAAQRSLSRLAGLGRPQTPKGQSAAELAAQAKKHITKPARRRNYGDGTELEIFDDLPTSATMESKFTKVPIGKGAPRSLRSKLGLSQFNASTTSLTSTIRTGSETPVPSTPLSPPKQDFPTISTTTATANIPRFARDTAASRIAREQRTISTTFQNMHGEPLQPISANFKISAAPRSNINSLRKKKSVQQKPHLIKPMGNDMNRPRDEKGMHWNPVLYRWEGNENALAPFDVPPPDFYPRQPSPLGQEARGKGSPTGSKERNVALISQIGNVSGVQVVGGMVFDPRQMRWLKMAEQPNSNRAGSVGDVQVEEEEDVFAGLEDLKEEDEKSHRSSAVHKNKNVPAQEYGLGIDSSDLNIAGPSRTASAQTERNRQSSLESKNSDEEGGHSSDEFAGNLAEEFDVGPDFIRRQKTEEERWRRKVEKWLRAAGEEQVEDEWGRGGWRWGIREIVGESEAGVQ